MYVYVYIYIYVRCTDILFGNTTRGVHEGWARKFHIYHRKNKTNIILLKFHRKTDGLSQQGRFGKLMVYPNKREGWRSKPLGFTKGFHLQLIPRSLQSHSLYLVSNVVFEMGMIVMSKQSVDTWGCFQHCKNPRSVLWYLNMAMRNPFVSLLFYGCLNGKIIYLEEITRGMFKMPGLIAGG